jgi:hypothetical protein
MDMYEYPSRNKKGEDVADTITEYSIQPKTIYSGNGGLNRNVANGRYDLMSTIFICLKDDTDKSKNKLISMLSTLLSSRLSVEEKKQALESKFALPMTAEMKKEAAAMCNLSEAIEEEAIRKNEEKNKKIIAEKDEVIAEKDKIIAELQAQLAKNK